MVAIYIGHMFFFVVCRSSKFYLVAVDIFMRLRRHDRVAARTTSPRPAALSACICEGIDGSVEKRHDLHLLCPICALVSSRLVAPDSGCRCSAPVCEALLRQPRAGFRTNGDLLLLLRGPQDHHHLHLSSC